MPFENKKYLFTNSSELDLAIRRDYYAALRDPQSSALKIKKLHLQIQASLI